MNFRALLLLSLVACSDTITSTTLEHLEDRDAAALERAAIGPYLAHADDLPAIETTLDDAVRGDFAHALRTPDDYEAVVRAAAIEWATKTRRHLGTKRLHTRVPALVDDTDCAGSVTQNAVLIDYVDAASRTDPDRTRVVAALHGLAKQMACLDQDQTATLAAAMKLAFDDVVTDLRIDALEGALPYLAQAVSSPMLLVHEVERRHGEDAPLSRWFRDYEAALVEGAHLLHHPARWHGVWLYDRITGRLRGFHATEKDTGDSSVDLAALFHTVANPTLDDLHCSLTEMVQRGVSANDRYECLGARCAAGDKDACATPSAGGGDTAPERGSSVDIPGMTLNSTLDCVTTQAAHTSSKQQLTCLMEATGRGANPLDAITKELTQVSLAGVKGGCDRAMTDTGVSAQDNYNMHVRHAEERYQQAMDKAEADHSAAIDALAAAQKDRAALDGSAATPEQIAEKDKAVDDAEKKVNEAEKKCEEAKAAAEAQREKEMQDAEDQREADEGDEGDDGSNESGDDRCVDGASCGCTALSAQAQALLDCATGGGTPETLDPLGGGTGCHGNCDPIDPEGAVPANACFDTLSLDDGASVSRACWAVRCGPGDQGGNACCGGALSDGTPAQMTPMCGDVDCADGQPTFSGGRCTCGAGEGAGLPGGPTMPTTNPYLPFGGPY